MSKFHRIPTTFKIMSICYLLMHSMLCFQQNSLDQMTSLKSMAQQAANNAGLRETLQEKPKEFHSTPQPADTRQLFDSVSTSQAPSQPTAPSPLDQGQQPSLTTQPPTPQQPQTTTIRLNPLLGVAPLGPQPLTREHLYQLAMQDAAYHHLPHPSDSERLRLVLRSYQG